MPRIRKYGPTLQSCPLKRSATHEPVCTAGRVLFARLGYEQTSTAAITRQAETSESQLTRHFEGKRGLLAAIFDESWRGVNQHVRAVAAEAGSANSAIEAVLATVIAGFDRDPDLAALFLFEGRRVHTGEQNVVLSQGYLEFVDFLHGLIRRAQAEKMVASAVDVRALFGAHRCGRGHDARQSRSLNAKADERHFHNRTFVVCSPHCCMPRSHINLARKSIRDHGVQHERLPFSAGAHCSVYVTYTDEWCLVSMQGGSATTTT